MKEDDMEDENDRKKLHLHLHEKRYQFPYHVFNLIFLTWYFVFTIYCFLNPEIYTHLRTVQCTLWEIDNFTSGMVCFCTWCPIRNRNKKKKHMLCVYVHIFLYILGMGFSRDSFCFFNMRCFWENVSKKEEEKALI